MKKRFAVTLVATFLAVCLGPVGLLAQSPVVDGYLRDPVTGVVEAPYVVQGITYTQDQVTGQFAGYLYAAEDEGSFYFGFAQSVEINDNTYGFNGIGWNSKRGHKRSDLTQSDHAKVRMYDCDNVLTLEFYIDYASYNKKTSELACLGVDGGDGSMLLGDPAMVHRASSALDWNFNEATPSYPNKEDTNPTRMPDNTYAPGTSANPAYPWIYEIGYEWAVFKSAFPGGCFGGLEILEVHNSPYKSGFNPVPVPVLNVSKESIPVSGSTVLAGDEITFTIKYSNPGWTALTDVLITDVVDLNLINIAPLDGGVYDDATRTITWPAIPSLAAGSSGSVSFTAVVEPLSVQEDSIYNTAVFTSPDLPSPAQTNTTVHYVEHSPDLAVSKTCPELLAAGSQATYEMTVSNLGLGAAENVMLTDVLPAEVTFSSANPAPTSVDGQSVVFSLGTMASGESAQVTIVVDVVSGTGIAVNTVSVSTTTAEGGEGLANNSDACSSTLQGPDVSVTKACPPELIAGQAATYVIEAANNGTADALNVVVTDVLPQGVAFINASPVPASVVGQTLTFNLGILPGGSAQTISVDVEALLTSGAATNTVSIASDSSEGGEGSANNQDSCASPFVAADIRLLKTCPPELVAGQTASYGVEVANLGSATATNVVVTDALPDGVTLLGATPEPAEVNGQVVSFNLGDIAAGGAVLISLEVLADATTGVGTNTAFATTDSLEGGEGGANNSDSCSSDFLAPDVRLVKSCPVDMVAGTDSAFTLSVLNAGNGTAVDVQVTDSLPAGVALVSATPAPASVTGQVVTFALGDLAAGAGATITITVTATATAGTETNTAVVSTASVEGGEGSANNSDSCSYPYRSPDIALVKTCPVDMIAGQTAAYSIDVTNLGDSVAANVVVIDTLPGGVALAAALPAPANVEGQVLTFNLGDLEPGGSATISIDVDITGTAGTATNSAAATTDSLEGGEGGANNSDSCSSTLLSPDIAVTKTCPVDMVAGQSALYSISVENTGSTAALGVTLSDSLPTGVTFVGAVPAPASVVGQSLAFELGDIPAGSTRTIDIEVSVDATSGTLSNAAAAETTSVEGGQGVANNADSCSSGVLAPDISIFKVCPVDMIAGESASYALVVVNNGSTVAHEVVVTDLLPAGVVFVSAMPVPTAVEGQLLVFETGDLHAGASLSISIEVLVEGTEGSATNSASVATSSTEGGLAEADNEDSCSSNLLAPDIALAKTCPVDMIAGAGASYGLTVSNLGTTTAADVVVVDTLPLGVAYVSAMPAPTLVDGQTLTFSLGDLPAGAASSITIDVLVESTEGMEANTATASTASVEGGQVGANNSDSCSSGFLSPDISLEKSCPVDMVAGLGAVYTIDVGNLGTTTALNVTVTDTLPAGVEFVSSTPAPVVVDGQILTFDLGDIESGATATIAINVAVLATEGTAINSALASTESVEGGLAGGNNGDSCSSNLLSPDLAVSKDCPVDMIAGEGASYAIDISNLGTTAAINVMVTDTLPAGVAFVSATPVPTLVDGQTLTFSLGDLPVAGSSTIIVEVIALATSGAALNTASATTDSVEGGQGAANNSDSCSSEFLAPDVTISKVCPADMIAGLQSFYTLDVTNLGTSTALAVSVTDVLPAGVSFVTATPTPASVDGQTLVFSLGDLAPGETASIAIEVTLVATEGSGTNTTSVSTASVESGEGVANNADSCSSNYLSADVRIVKDCAPGAVVTNSEYSFITTFNNDGTSAAHQVVVVDNVPAGFFQDGVFVAESTLGTVSVDGLQVTVDIGDMEPGVSGTLTITGTVTASVGARGTYTTDATITTASTQASGANDAAECSLVVAAPELSMTKESVVSTVSSSFANSVTSAADEIVEAGAASNVVTAVVASRIAYTITVTNEGDATASNVQVLDTLPSGVAVIDNPAGGMVVGDTVSWAVPSLAAGASASFSLTVETLNQ